MGYFLLENIDRGHDFSIWSHQVVTAVNKYLFNNPCQMVMGPEHSMLINCQWSLCPFSSKGLLFNLLMVLIFQNSRLYYENTTGIYYYYDEPSATYKFHSKIDLSNNQEETVKKDKNDLEEQESGEEYSDDGEDDKDSEGL